MPKSGYFSHPTDAADRRWEQFVVRRTVLVLCGVALAACVSSPPTPPKAATELERISARLLAASSATLTLEAECASQGLADPAVVVVRHIDTVDNPPSPEQRARLGVGPDDIVKYRHVQLVCGDTVLSVAENWYVPGRLTPEMNELLDTTRTPFGKVIRDLGPKRTSLGVIRGDWLARVGSGQAAGDAPGCEETAFSHAAVVEDRNGAPLAEVRENYRMAVAC